MLFQIPIRSVIPTPGVEITVVDFYRPRSADLESVGNAWHDHRLVFIRDQLLELNTLSQETDSHH